ncbi:hypothetical protein MACJ_000764 [Theileria orientalis]|uniref:EGF-like domain-containing protein n=1 Tax=Theileria orientalis TaxID=68886 RepID=A0A976M4M2_THEOR|nr:hypothetical protein MACJ_000764 [Theileria orientalis]
MKLIVFLIFNIYIASVSGFFYTLLPLAVIKKENQYKAYCPWNQTRDNELKCKVNKGVMGYVHSKSDQTSDTLPEPKEFLNPALQKRFTKDNCAKIKGEWTTSKNTETVCNKYSFCFNVADDKSVCACQSGFFGDPYKGCHQHCLTDDDCSSPLARCADATNTNELKRCVCKQGYDGDGVSCHKDVCGTDRKAKCGTDKHKVCIPTGSGTNDFACVCETGYYLNHEGTCVEEHTVKENTVITLVGKNIKDGSRVELGECLSFVINDKTKSIFYHKNSGDSIYVRSLIKNENQFSIFFIVTKEVTAFSLLKDNSFGLTKLYSMTNTFLDCKFGNARIFDPEGHDLSDDESFVNATIQATATSSTGTGGVAAAAAAALQIESSLDEPASAGTPTPTQGGKSKPSVEVHVRPLTEEEKSGGLAGHTILPTVLQMASREEQEGLEIGSSRAKGHHDASHLQMSISPETARQMDL